MNTAQAKRDVEWMIDQMSTTATLTRPVTTGAASFYGTHETSETSIGTIKIDLRETPTKDLLEIGADAIATTSADSGVQENDFLSVGQTRYRVAAVKPHNFFGTLSHVELHLARERR